jgi:hypothetical protein
MEAVVTYDSMSGSTSGFPDGSNGPRLLTGPCVSRSGS